MPDGVAVVLINEQLTMDSYYLFFNNL